MQRRDISMGIFGAATASALLAKQSQAQTCTPPCYAVIAQETAAGVTPSNTQYIPGDVRRYGAVMDGTTDDASAWKLLAKVMAQGVNGYAPPLPTMLKSQVAISAPTTRSITLYGYGCTLFTTGAIDALQVSGGGFGGLSVYGLTHNNTTDGKATNGFNGIGCLHCSFIDCNIVIPSSLSSASGYSGVVFQPTSDGNGFFNSVVRLLFRVLETRLITHHLAYDSRGNVMPLGSTTAA